MLSNTAKKLIVNLKSSLNLNENKALFHLGSIRKQNETRTPTADAAAADQQQTSPLPTNEEYKQLQEKLSKQEASLVEFKDRYMRALAEAENTRIRMNKQVADAKIYGIQGFCKDLLEVADILNLAIANTDPNKNSEQNNNNNNSMEQLQSMFNGLVMTEKCLIKIFAKHGLTQIIPSDSEKFNPNFHEAIFRIPMPDKTSGNFK